MAPLLLSDNATEGATSAAAAVRKLQPFLLLTLPFWQSPSDHLPNFVPTKDLADFIIDPSV